MEASLGIIFSKLLSNTVKIKAFPSPTCYAASADMKACGAETKPSFLRVQGRVCINKGLGNGHSGLF